MPTSAKRPRKPPESGKEFFYLDDNHDKQDADLHHPILDGGEHEAARKVSMNVMKRLGLTSKQIEALTKDKR